MATAVNHQDNFATNLTSNQSAGVTTTPLNSIPSVAAQFYIALDATNINNHYEVVLVTSKTATNINHAATTYDHTTAEEVRMVVPAAELDELNDFLVAGAPAADGWTAATGTWTYASATTITVPSGAASIYKKGDKIKLTQTTAKYFYVTGVADTLLTVTGGADYSVANAAITSPYYSHQTSPIGFPDYFTFTGAASGMTSVSETHKFSLDGTVCTIQSVTSGTGSTTARTITLPIAAKEEVRMAVYTINNGTTAVGRMDTAAGSTTLTLYSAINGAAWTASGSSAAQVTLSYIIN